MSSPGGRVWETRRCSTTLGPPAPGPLALGIRTVEVKQKDRVSCHQVARGGP